MRLLLSFVLSLLLLPPTSSRAQISTASFQFPKPAPLQLPSRYSSLQILDLRSDTTNLGTVQIGILQGGQKTYLVAEKGLQSHIQHLFQALAASPSDTGNLLLILRRFAFVEWASPGTNGGKAVLQAALFARESTGNYRLLHQLDSTLVLPYRGEGTEELIRKGAVLFTSFLGHSLSQFPAGEIVYTEANLRNTDSLLKAQLPLFQKETLAEGLYLTWESFAQQQPDHQIKAQAGNGIVMNVKTVDEKPGETAKKCGWWITVNVKTVDEKPGRKFGYNEMYALVHKGIPYIATEFGYYKLKKIGTDWIFTGRMREVASQGALLLGGFGGLVGVATVAENTTATYEIRLDPAGGRFIKLRQVKGSR